MGEVDRGAGPWGRSEGALAPRIVLVTDPSYGDAGILRCVRGAAGALPAGMLAVQLRDKLRPRASLRVFAHELRVVTRDVGAMLVVNGDAEVARDVGADGVHLGGGEDTTTVAGARHIVRRRCWVSVAAHSEEDVRAAAHAGADAVLVSPVFDTKGKKGRGLEALRREATRVSGAVTVVALGGVNGANARACARAGAQAVAVMSALLGSADPYSVARALHDALVRDC